MNIFNKRDRIYIIDCSDARLMAAVLDYSGDEITFLKLWNESHNNLGWFLKKLNPPKDSPIIFLHGGNNAATYLASVKFEKSDNKAIGEHELSELLSKAATQFFNRFNEEAKKRLGLDEVGLVLASSRIFDLKLDNQSLVTPIGAKAKSAEVLMEQTFISREILHEISESLPQTKNIFHIEQGGAASDLFNSFHNGERIMCALVSDDTTKLFSYEAKPKYFGAVSFPSMLPRGEIAWGSNSAIKELMNAIGVNHEIAIKVVGYFKEGRMSRRFSNIFLKVVRSASESFCDGLEEHIKDERHTFVIASAPLPFLENGRKDTTVLRNDHLGEIFNFGVKYSRELQGKFLSPIFILGLIAYLRRTGDNYLKGFIDKKLRWLQPENSI